MNIYARSALIGLFVTFTGVPAIHSGEYYIYRDIKGVLVISNQKPPPGSKIIKQQSLPDVVETDNPQVQDGFETHQTAISRTRNRLRTNSCGTKLGLSKWNQTHLHF